MTSRMDGPFLAKLALTFLAGGLWVAVSTAIADRAGAKIGGWMSGLPSTVAVALFFIGLTQTPEAAAEAANMVPLVAGANGLFLLSFVRFSRRGFALGFGGAFVVWFAAAAALSLIKNVSLIFSIAGFAVILPSSYLLLDREIRMPSPGGGNAAPTPAALAGRALLSGLIVTSAVVVAKLGGPLLGGIFAAFPGVFSSTILIAFRSRGLDFARVIVKPMMASGLVNVAVYAVAVRFAYPAAGLAAGTVMAYAASLVSAALAFLFISRSS